MLVRADRDHRHRRTRRRRLRRHDDNWTAGLGCTRRGRRIAHRRTARTNPHRRRTHRPTPPQPPPPPSRSPTTTSSRPTERRRLKPRMPAGGTSVTPMRASGLPTSPLTSVTAGGPRSSARHPSARGCGADRGPPLTHGQPPAGDGAPGGRQAAHAVTARRRAARPIDSAGRARGASSHPDAGLRRREQAGVIRVIAVKSTFRLGPVAALMSEELEHVCWPHGHRIHLEHGEEPVQIERHRPHRVRPAPPSDKLEIAVHERISQRISGAHRRARRTGPDTGTGSSPHAHSPLRSCRGCPKITRVLGDRASCAAITERGLGL